MARASFPCGMTPMEIPHVKTVFTSRQETQPSLPHWAWGRTLTLWAPEQVLAQHCLRYRRASVSFLRTLLPASRCTVAPLCAQFEAMSGSWFSAKHDLLCRVHADCRALLGACVSTLEHICALITGAAATYLVVLVDTCAQGVLHSRTAMVSVW